MHKNAKFYNSKLANFYSGLIVLLFWLIIIFILITIISLFFVDSVAEGTAVIAALGMFVLCIIAIGGVAVALDIMNTNRNEGIVDLNLWHHKILLKYKRVV